MKIYEVHIECNKGSIIYEVFRTLGTFLTRGVSVESQLSLGSNDKSNDHHLGSNDKSNDHTVQSLTIHLSGKHEELREDWMVCWRHLLTLTSEGSPPCAKLVRWFFFSTGNNLHCASMNSLMIQWICKQQIKNEALIYFYIMIPWTLPGKYLIHCDLVALVRSNWSNLHIPSCPTYHRSQNGVTS